MSFHCRRFHCDFSATTRFSTVSKIHGR